MLEELTGELLFSGHAIGADEDAGQKNPRGHADEFPDTQTEPAGQGTEMPFVHRAPAAHAVGAVELGRHTEPAGQDAALVAPARHRNP